VDTSGRNRKGGVVEANHLKTMGAALMARVAVALIALLAVSACRPNQDNFRSSMDFAIDRSIKAYTSLPHEVKLRQDGMHDYIFSDQSGCSWAFVVNADQTIVSWHYVSDRKLCVRGLNWGGR